MRVVTLLTRQEAVTKMLPVQLKKQTPYWVLGGSRISGVRARATWGDPGGSAKIQYQIAEITPLARARFRSDMPPKRDPRAPDRDRFRVARAYYSVAPRLF